MIDKRETFFVSWQSLHLDEISKRFDLQEGRAERKSFFDTPENRPTLTLSVGFIPFLHFMGLAMSTLLVKCRSNSVLKSNFVHPVYLLMQKPKLGGAWPELLCLLKAESQRHPVLQLEPQLPPTRYGQTGPWIKVQVRRHCKGGIFWMPGSHPLVYVKRDLALLLLLLSWSRSFSAREGKVRQYCSKLGDCLQSHGKIWQTILQLQIVGFLIC